MKTTKRTTSPKKTRTRKKHEATTDLALTELEGEPYNGTGTTQAWTYQKAAWEEKKTGADVWEIHYNTRAGKQPKPGTALPKGSAGHWLIIAHQKVTKLASNTYEASVTGVKFKLAHKTGPAEKWSAGEKTRRKSMIKALHKMIVDLELNSGRAPAENRKIPAAAASALPAKPKRTTRKKQ